ESESGEGAVPEARLRRERHPRRIGTGSAGASHRRGGGVGRREGGRRAGGVQIVARMIETGLHKMDTIGFDVNRVVSACGTAPLPPVARSDTRAIGRTNDCILYGGQARYTVRADDEELAHLATRLPASASADYGTPFYDIFKRYDSDFYKIDPLLFSPAEVWLTSAATGRTFHGGRVDPDVLRASLLGDRKSVV